MNRNQVIDESVEGEIRSLQGFAVHVLKNPCVELGVVPALGARIISLVDRRTGREWMWHPRAGLKLFTNRPDDDFSISPLAGMDDCVPTISRCTWRGRELPDHGEVWAQPWQLDEEAWSRGRLTTRVHLPISPFELERAIELRGNEVNVRYRLRNLAGAEEPFLWAMHPLLRLIDGDQLELPDATHGLIGAGNWRRKLASVVPENESVKAFAHPLTEGNAAIENEATGDRLEFVWNTAENNTLGLWLTRGAWHGHHHFALEPANAADDSLAVAVAQNQAGRVPPHASATWAVHLRVGI
jgi:hypothetical protein